MCADKSASAVGRDERIATRQARLAAYAKQANTPVNNPLTNNLTQHSTQNRANNAQQNQQADAETSVQSGGALSVAGEQCVISRAVVQSSITECTQQLHQHIARFEAAECDRRDGVGEVCQSIDTMIQNVTDECQQLNEQLCSTWSQLTDAASSASSPNELHDRLCAQLSGAQHVLAKKQSIVDTLQQHISNLNQQYIAAIELQRRDIDVGIDIVDSSYHRVLGQSRSELDQCEQAFSTQRAQLLAAHNTELTAIYDKRRALELSIHSTVQRQEQQYSDSLDQIRQNDVNDYSTLKAELESNIELFQLQLESMKSIYALNSDKLLYNYTILQQKDLDNKLALEQTRSKLRKLKDTMNTYTQRYSTLYNQFKCENVALSGEYSRLIATYKHLQNKYIYFQTNSALKYAEVWQHSEQENLHIIKQVLEADQKITQNILNQSYTLPTLYAPQNDTCQPAVIADLTIDMLTRSVNRATPLSLSDSMQDAQLVDKQSAHRGTHNRACTAEQQRRILDALIVHAAYLLPSQAGESSGDTPLHTADQLLTSLGVHDMEDYNTLISAFIDENGQLLELTHSRVRGLVQQFIASSSSAQSQSSTHLLHTRLHNEKQQKQNKRIQQYWTDLRAVIQEKSCEMWQVLEQRLCKYNHILQERQQLINETSNIAKQNAELKELLVQYVG